MTLSQSSDGRKVKQVNGAGEDRGYRLEVAGGCVGRNFVQKAISEQNEGG
jgi:hypothetical protein